MRLTSVLAILATAGTAAAGPGHRQCTEAARAHVQLPAGVDGIDGFRIFVSDAGVHQKSDVTVVAGHADRTLRAFAPGVFALLLDAPLVAHTPSRRGVAARAKPERSPAGATPTPAYTIDIAVEPVLDVPMPACVDRVELLRAGQVVGTAEIK